MKFVRIKGIGLLNWKGSSYSLPHDMFVSDEDLKDLTALVERIGAEIVEQQGEDPFKHNNKIPPISKILRRPRKKKSEPEEIVVKDTDK